MDDAEDAMLQAALMMSLAKPGEEVSLQSMYALEA